MMNILIWISRDVMFNSGLSLGSYIVLVSYVQCFFFLSSHMFYVFLGIGMLLLLLLCICVLKFISLHYLFLSFPRQSCAWDYNKFSTPKQ